MDNIQITAVSVLFLSAAVYIADILTSGTGMEKTVRYVTGLMVLCTIAVPLYNNVMSWQYDISLSSFDYECTNDFSEQEKKLLEQNLRQLVIETLKNEGIDTSSVNVSIKIDDNKVTEISARVALDRTQAELMPRVRSIVHDELGIECEAVVDKA